MPVKMALVEKKGKVMIKEIIYNYLQKDDDHVSKASNNFAPSYLTDCRRKIYYKKTACLPSNPIEPPAKLKMEMGNMIYEYIRKVLQETISAKYIEGEEWRFKNWQDLDWIYRVDNIIEIDDKKYVIECKSTYMSGWQAIEKQAKEEHILQLFLYMIFEEIEDCILIYIGRDNGFMVEYQFTLDKLIEDYGEYLDNRILDLLKLKIQIDNKELPDRDYQIYLKRTESVSFEFQKDNEKYKTDYQCSYCQYKNYCWDDILTKIQPNQFYINGKIIEKEKING
jgi:hypothetical protein